MRLMSSWWFAFLLFQPVVYPSCNCSEKRVLLSNVGMVIEQFWCNGLLAWQFFIALSCLISVSVNFSTFLVIGKTSAVTYQVLGHLKTCLVLAFGYILLKNPFSWRNICGILVAVLGMGLYSIVSVKESQQKIEDIPPVNNQVISLTISVGASHEYIL